MSCSRKQLVSVIARAGVVSALGLLLFVRPVRVQATGGTLVVNSTEDTTVAGDGACTLREAIINVNTAADLTDSDCASGTGGGDVVRFAIPGSGPQTIHLQDGLPTLITPITIDGSTQPGYVANTAVTPNPFNGVQAVEIDGSGIDPNSNYQPCFHAYGTSNIAFNAVTINSCAGDGIRLEHVDNFSLKGSYVGVDTSGLITKPNGGFDSARYHGSGIYEEFVNHATIGGTQPAERNIITSNQFGEVFIQSWYTGSDPNRPVDNSYATIQGNYMGLAADGLTALPCGYSTGHGNAILITNSAHDLIGGTAPGAKNVIASSREFGVSFRDGSLNSSVQGNYIGTDYTGAKAASHVYGTGNISDGISVATVSNGGYFVTSHDIQIGGTTEAARNIISGNNGTLSGQSGAAGIDIHDDAYAISVQGNYIGTDVSGTKAVPNRDAGVQVSSPGNLIGGITAAAGNLVSGNNQGIAIYNTNNNAVQNNRVGVDSSGAKTLGNTQNGITVNGSSNSVVGNTVSGNGQGLSMYSASNNTVQGNRIGLDTTGTKLLGNVGAGIMVGNSTGNTIGGATAASGNTVGGSTQALYLNNSQNNTIQANNFGTDATETKNFANGVGIIIDGSSNNLIGCRVNPCRNLIANNTQSGMILIGDSNRASAGNKLTGNTIRNNANLGLGIIGAVTGSQIGGTSTPDFNYIASNNGPGIAVIELQGSALYPANNSMLGNRLFANTGGSIDHMADADGDYNPELFAGSTPNNTAGTNDLQNYPTISNASFSGGNVTFTYSFSPRSGVAAPNGYRLEFYGGADAKNGRFMLGSVNVSGAVTNQTVTMPLKNGLNLKYLMGSATGMLSPITFGSTSEFTPGLLITGMPANY